MMGDKNIRIYYFDMTFRIVITGTNQNLIRYSSNKSYLINFVSVCCYYFNMRKNMVLDICNLKHNKCLMHFKKERERESK